MRLCALILLKRERERERESYENCKNLLDRLQNALDKELWRDSKSCISLLEEVRLFAQHAGLGGVLVLIDEAGKSIEYALQDKAGGDVYLFQALAEYANRTQGSPVVLVTIQHQVFEAYNDIGHTSMRFEWAKVQQRFETISFNERLSASISLLGQVFTQKRSLPKGVQAAIKTAAHALLAADVRLPGGMSNKDFYALCQKAWPLHPTVVLSLPSLFRQFAQNERSLFSYLTSQEPFGFQEHCTRLTEQDYGFVRLHDIGEYLLNNMATILVHKQAAQILLETMDNYDGAFTPYTRNVLLTIGVLQILGHQFFLKATDAVLQLALAQPPQDESLSHCLQKLCDTKILTIRNADHSYQLWEGGLVDLNALLEEAESQIRPEGEAFLALLHEYLPMRPFLARRHMRQTGAYRCFSLTYALSPETLPPTSQSFVSLQPMTTPQSWQAGRIGILFPLGDETNLEAKALHSTAQEKDLVLALPTQIDMLRAPALMLAKLRFIAAHTPQLKGDRKAQHLFSLLLSETEQKLHLALSLLLDPRPAPHGNACRWFWQGKEQHMHSKTDITSLLSTVCDTLYPYAPKIDNEFIARPVLSSQATGARTVLLKRMLTHAHQARLGIEGFPPEYSIYASVLLRTKLHQPQADGVWDFQPPSATSPLFALWQTLADNIYANQGEAFPLTQLFGELAKAPLGVPEGLHPVFLLAFYLCHRDEVFLYREGSFLVELQEADIELMQRRPDLFAISGVRLEGERKKLVERYARGLQVQATVPAVVERLYMAIKQLPHLTLHTTKLTPTRGQALRDSFFKARSPEKLLFAELPQAFGMPNMLTTTTGDLAETFASNMRESMTELVNYAPSIRNQSRDILLNACALPTGACGWQAFLERAVFLGQRVRQGALVPLLDRAQRQSSSAEALLEGVLAVVSGRPFVEWNDMIADNFAAAARGLGEQFQQQWLLYGKSFLNAQEQKDKDVILSSLQQEISVLKAQYSPRALAEALRDTLRQLEEESLS